MVDWNVAVEERVNLETEGRRAIARMHSLETG